MSDPLNKSQTDAMFLRILAKEFTAFQPIISKVTEGRFCFSAACLEIIAEKLERNGYDDDAPAPDAELKDIRERVYGSTLAYEREQALKE